MTLAQMLADAQAKYHQLMTGRLAVEVIVDGQTTRFNRANANELLAYIARLTAQLAASGGGCQRITGAIGVIF